MLIQEQKKEDEFGFYMRILVRFGIPIQLMKSYVLPATSIEPNTINAKANAFVITSCLGLLDFSLSTIEFSLVPGFTISFPKQSRKDCCSLTRLGSTILNASCLIDLLNETDLGKRESDTLI